MVAARRRSASSGPLRGLQRHVRRRARSCVQSNLPAMPTIGEGGLIPRSLDSPVEALIGSARADHVAGAFLFVTDPAAAFFAAEAKLTRALSSVPDHPGAHMYLGLLHIVTKRAAQGIAECEHALALDRNLADAHSYVGFGKIYIGRAE